MMDFVRCGHMFLNRSLLDPSRCAAHHCSAMQLRPKDADTLVRQKKFRPIAPNDRTIKDWAAIAWPTNIQSGTPDGKFGPVRQMQSWKDCWFLAALAAVANDPDGHQLLAESINKVDGGYDVTFKAAPNNNVFISDAELREPLEASGGDADTRLMELAADKFFNESGSFKSLYIAGFLSRGMNQELAKQCFQNFCNNHGIQDPMTHNPMRHKASIPFAFFMFTGVYPVSLVSSSSITLHSSDIMTYLNWYVANDQDGASVAIGGIENPLGDSVAAQSLAVDWDVIRTEITSNGTVNPQPLAFLKALDQWLATRSPNDLQALQSAAGNLKLDYINPEGFVKILKRNLLHMNPEHVNVLRSGVQEVIGGGPGYIGFPGGHAGILEGINEAAGTFTYSEPNSPTLVHTGELQGLIQAIKSRDVFLTAVEPTIGREDSDRQHSEHAGTSRGRRLRQIHNQVVRDGKIDQTESGPLADLMEMGDDTFRQIYDSDKNGVIEGGELKAVQKRVDRWVEHFELTPIW